MSSLETLSLLQEKWASKLKVVWLHVWYSVSGPLCVVTQSLPACEPGSSGFWFQMSCTHPGNSLYCILHVHALSNGSDQWRILSLYIVPVLCLDSRNVACIHCRILRKNRDVAQHFTCHSSLDPSESWMQELFSQLWLQSRKILERRSSNMVATRYTIL